jgi:flagellar hook-associated protein 2
MSGVSLSGLGTGLDIESLITGLMSIERRPQQMLINRKTRFETVGTSLDSVRSKLTALRFSASDLASVAGWEPVTATTSDATRATVTATNASTTGSITFRVMQLATAKTSASNDTFAAGATVTTNGTIDLTVKGATHNISVGDGSLESVVTAINTANKGVTATAVQVGANSFRLQLTAAEGAESNDMAVTGLTGVSSWLNVSNGRDSRIQIGGAGGYTIDSPGNTISNVLPGTSINLLRVGTTTNVTVSTKRDSDKVADRVAAMVEKLNEVAKEIKEQTKVDTVNNTRSPLTGNSAVRNIQSQLAEAVMGDANTNAGQYGLSTSRDGTFTFDRAKFIAAYNADPVATAQAFQDGPVQGVAFRISEVARKAVDSVEGPLTSARDANNAQIQALNASIQSYEQRLTRKEAQLRRQFASLDSTIGQMRAQNSWLQQQLGNG